MFEPNLQNSMSGRETKPDKSRLPWHLLKNLRKIEVLLKIQSPPGLELIDSGELVGGRGRLGTTRMVVLGV